MTTTWQRRIGLAAPVLVLYWITLAVATHMPGETASIPPPWDKLIHAGGYGLLAFLAAFVWRGRTLARLTGYVYLWNVIAVYAALDELTQPYFNRTCDIYDWLADVCGVLAGLILHAAWCSWTARKSESTSA